MKETGNAPVLVEWEGDPQWEVSWSDEWAAERMREDRPRMSLPKLPKGVESRELNAMGGFSHLAEILNHGNERFAKPSQWAKILQSRGAKAAELHYSGMGLLLSELARAGDERISTGDLRKWWSESAKELEAVDIKQDATAYRIVWNSTKSRDAMRTSRSEFLKMMGATRGRNTPNNVQVIGDDEGVLEDRDGNRWIVHYVRDGLLQKNVSDPEQVDYEIVTLARQERDRSHLDEWNTHHVVIFNPSFNPEVVAEHRNLDEVQVLAQSNANNRFSAGGNVDESIFNLITPKWPHDRGQEIIYKFPGIKFPTTIPKQHYTDAIFHAVRVIKNDGAIHLEEYQGDGARRLQMLGHTPEAAAKRKAAADSLIDFYANLSDREKQYQTMRSAVDASLGKRLWKDYKSRVFFGMPDAAIIEHIYALAVEDLIAHGFTPYPDEFQTAGVINALRGKPNSSEVVSGHEVAIHEAMAEGVFYFVPALIRIQLRSLMGLDGGKGMGPLHIRGENNSYGAVVRDEAVRQGLTTVETMSTEVEWAGTTVINKGLAPLATFASRYRHNPRHSAAVLAARKFHGYQPQDAPYREEKKYIERVFTHAIYDNVLAGKNYLTWSHSESRVAKWGRGEVQKDKLGNTLELVKYDNDGKEVSRENLYGQQDMYRKNYDSIPVKVVRKLFGGGVAPRKIYINNRTGEESASPEFRVPHHDSSGQYTYSTTRKLNPHEYDVQWRIDWSDEWAADLRREGRPMYSLPADTSTKPQIDDGQIREYDDVRAGFAMPRDSIYASAKKYVEKYGGTRLPRPVLDALARGDYVGALRAARKVANSGERAIIDRLLKNKYIASIVTGYEEMPQTEEAYHSTVAAYTKPIKSIDTPAGSMGSTVGAKIAMVNSFPVAYTLEALLHEGIHAHIATNINRATLRAQTEETRDGKGKYRQVENSTPDSVHALLELKRKFVKFAYSDQNARDEMDIDRLGIVQGKTR